MRLYVSRRGERGAVTAEFALMAGILLLFLMMCLEVGLILHTQLVLASAAREGGRQAAVDGGWSSRVEERVLNLLEMGGLRGEAAAISVQPQTAAYGRPVNVQVLYPYEVRSGILRTVLPGIIDLQARVVTRSERLAAD